MLQELKKNQTFIAEFFIKNIKIVKAPKDIKIFDDYGNNESF